MNRNLIISSITQDVAIKVYFGKDYSEGTLLDYKKEVRFAMISTFSEPLEESQETSYKCITMYSADWYNEEIEASKCLALHGSMLLTGTACNCHRVSSKVILKC